jgi:protein-tyrosine phosphatase
VPQSFAPHRSLPQSWRDPVESKEKSTFGSSALRRVGHDANPLPVIDLHLHILPGVDDGPRTLDESVALASASFADGVRVAAATPHVRDDYPTRVDEMERLVEEVRSALASAEIALDLRPGGEVALERLPTLTVDELRRFGLGGTQRYLLLEFPYYGWPLGLQAHVSALTASGFVPVLAHPERNLDVQIEPERLRPIVEQGALVQLTAASVDGRLGTRTRAIAFELLDRSLAHLLASDAHGAEIREGGLSSAVSALGNPELARWLTTELPAAMLAGRPLPERSPPRARGIRRLRRLRGGPR